MKKILLLITILLIAVQLEVKASWENSNPNGKTDGGNLAGRFVLSQNYPNPFNPETTVKFSIDKEGYVTLKIFNVIGQEVKTLISEVMNIGEHEVKINGNDLQSGVYFYTLTVGNYSQTKRMILMK